MSRTKADLNVFLHERFMSPIIDYCTWHGFGVLWDEADKRGWYVNVSSSLLPKKPGESNLPNTHGAVARIAREEGMYTIFTDKPQVALALAVARALDVFPNDEQENAAIYTPEPA